MAQQTRRCFLRASTAAVLGAPAVVRGSPSPNERIRVGLVGMGNRMRALARALVKLGPTHQVQIVAVCDCDRAQLDSIPERFPELKDHKFAVYEDMRKLFDDRSIDGVVISIGDRWHALATIWACQAGKDVYVEKPAAHNLFESRQMVQAARKYLRVVQHGTQNRSSPNIREGIQKLHEGVIGHVYAARGIDYKIRPNLGRIEPAPVPPGLDWDQWLGPKAMRPYSVFTHRRWYWLLDLSSGDFANQAIHELDIIRWGLQLDRHPRYVSSVGGKYVHQDDRTAPTHAAWHYRWDHPEPLVTYEHRSWYTNSEAGFRDRYPFVEPMNPVGTIFLGTEGYLIFPDYSSYYTFLGPKYEPGPSKAEEGHPMMDEPHLANWLDAMRSRDPSKLTAPIEEGHKSLVLSLLARVSYEVGRPLWFDPDSERVLGDDEADRLLNEPQYRKPYVVPQEV
jgi:predicted dehydrogenase